jgi:hypothetical protein
MIDKGLIAFVATSHHTIAFQIQVCPALEAHVIVARRTNDVIAPRTLLNRSLAMRTGLAKSANGAFRFPRVLVGFVVAQIVVTAHGGMSVAVDTAKGMLTTKTGDLPSCNVCAAFNEVVVLGCFFAVCIDGFLTTSAGNQGLVDRESMQSLKVNPVKFLFCGPGWSV